MFSPYLHRSLLLGLLAGLLCSCASLQQGQKTAKNTPQMTANIADHAAFRAEKGWKKKIFRDDAIMALAKPGHLSVQISIADQRGLLWVDKSLGMDFPVSTGRKTHPTPTGDFKVLVKELTHHSNLYGKIVDAEGNVTVENADATKNIPGEGEIFDGASMPNFMRLTNDGVGMHIGVVPGYPASHGCIRLPRKAALELYDLLPIGTPVTVTEKVEFATPPAPATPVVPAKKK